MKTDLTNKTLTAIERVRTLRDTVNGNFRPTDTHRDNGLEDFWVKVTNDDFTQLLNVLNDILGDATS